VNLKAGVKVGLAAMMADPLCYIKLTLLKCWQHAALLGASEAGHVDVVMRLPSKNAAIGLWMQTFPLHLQLCPDMLSLMPSYVLHHKKFTGYLGRAYSALNNTASKQTSQGIPHHKLEHTLPARLQKAGRYSNVYSWLSTSK
jgi:hypothetical protein